MTNNRKNNTDTMDEIIVSTNNFNTVQTICKDALKYSKMVSIIGNPGLGKTTALEYYLNNNKNVIYIWATASMSARDLFTQLLNTMGIEGKNLGNNLHALINHVAYKLNYEQERKLLIIDEAGKFKPRFLEYLHELRDKTEHTTGIVLAGPEYFHENMQKWKNKGVIGVPEVFRRIQHWEYLLRPTKPEIATLCKAHGIESLELIRKIQKEASENFSQVVYAIKAIKILQNR